MNSNVTFDEPIEVLVMEEQQNDADTYVTALKNAGITVHYTHTNHLNQLTEHLERKKFDFVIYGMGLKNIPFPSAIALLRKLQNEAVLLVIVKNTQQLSQRHLIMKQGVRDVIVQDQLNHLQMAVSREYVDYFNRKALVKLKRKLLESENRCSSLVENSRDAISYIHEGMYINANQTYMDMFGYVDLDELQGMPIMDMVAPDDLNEFKRFLRSIDENEGVQSLKLRCRNSNDEIFDAQLDFSPASIDGEPCTQIIIHDQSNSKELEEKIKLLSDLDSQTGLANRHAFMQTLENLLEQEGDSRSKGSLFYILIDNLQEIRSNSGIIAGDALLKEMAELLSEITDETEFLSRFGEHTFTLFTERSKDNIEKLAATILEAVEKRDFESVDRLMQPSISIGISTLTPKTADVQTLINHSYKACEIAHTDGGNQFNQYDPSKLVSVKDAEKGNELQLNALIDHALENDKFKLVFQPLVSLKGDSRENYAVLLRLMDKDGNEIFPEHFLSSAEQGDQMNQIDRWVVQNAIKTLSKHRVDNRRVNFFITLSAAAVEDDQFLLWICDNLRDHKAKGAWLTFQFHEEDVRAHTQNSRRLMEGLKKIGCQIAIDRFGKLPKYETLLKHLPLDFAKIDQSFAVNLATDQEKQDGMNEITKKIQEYDIKSVAVGVDDANSLAVLWTIGVSYIQGYYLQEPSENIDYDFSSF